MSENAIRIELQNESKLEGLPEPQQFKQWIKAALQKDYKSLEQTIRIVDETESQALNKTYRHRDKPTNVLSFPADASEYLDYSCLGDLVICAPIVEREAREQDKTLEAHWAHLVVHGMLHLQGYDHETKSEAEEMEALEIDILAKLGHTNPYQITETEING